MGLLMAWDWLGNNTIKSMLSNNMTSHFRIRSPPLFISNKAPCAEQSAGYEALKQHLVTAPGPLRHNHSVFMVIFLGMASSAFGSISLNTPSFSSASILS